MKSYRTFIAVKITPESKLIDLFDSCKESLKGEAIKWVDEKNMHLTLKFLGKTSENQIEKIKITLEELSSHFNVFNFDLTGCGCFKWKGKPQVLIAGIQNFESLSIFVSELEKSLVELGFKKEKQEFKPHLTLGRIKFLKDKKRFYHLVELNTNIEIQSVKVSEIIFYQSILKPQGPEYIPIKNVKFKNMSSN